MNHQFYELQIMLNRKTCLIFFRICLEILICQIYHSNYRNSIKNINLLEKTFCSCLLLIYFWGNLYQKNRHKKIVKWIKWWIIHDSIRIIIFFRSSFYFYCFSSFFLLSFISILLNGNTLQKQAFSIPIFIVIEI